MERLENIPDTGYLNGIQVDDARVLWDHIIKYAESNGLSIELGIFRFNGNLELRHPPKLSSDEHKMLNFLLPELNGIAKGLGMEGEFILDIDQRGNNGSARMDG